MPHSSTTVAPRGILCRLLAVLCLLFSVVGPSLSAQDAVRRSFDLPAGAAEAALKRFSEQSGHGLLISTETARDVRTNPVKGEFTAREALEKMLAGTGLVGSQDPKNGAFVVRREPPAPPAKNAVSPVAEGASAAGPTVTMESVEVTGSRIRTLLGEQQLTPTFTMGRQQIDRTGATNLGDLFRYIPAITGSSNGQSPEAGNGNGTGGVLASQIGVSASLRGFDAAATLILVDGRRVNKMSQNSASPRYDAIGLPMAAIERIEVLLDGGARSTAPTRSPA